MTDASNYQPRATASILREALRRDLTAAIKTRQTDTVTVLRTALAAIDNAEAITVSGQDRTKVITSEYIAGASAGLGSTEATRRDLSLDDLHAILQEQITERTNAAEIYDAHGQAQAADRLRREADVLRKYIS